MTIGPYSENSIVVGDCLEVMPELPDKSFDMILCDLPYGTTACKWDVIIPFEPLWGQYKRITKENAAIVLMATQPFASMLVMSNFPMFKYEWVWDKLSGGAFVLSKIRPMQTHENILVFGNGRICYNPIMEEAQPQNIRPPNRGSSGGNTVPVAGGIAKSSKLYDPQKRFPKTVMRISRYAAECNSRNRIHPTQKPITLFEYLIKTYTNEGDFVLDNCMGSGTTAVAADRLGRRYFGCDISEEYVAMANERIAKDRVKRAQMKMELG